MYVSGSECLLNLGFCCQNNVSLTRSNLNSLTFFYIFLHFNSIQTYTCIWIGIGAATFVLKGGGGKNQQKCKVPIAHLIAYFKFEDLSDFT